MISYNTIIKYNNPDLQYIILSSAYAYNPLSVTLHRYGP